MSYKEKCIPFIIATKHIEFLGMILRKNMYERKKIYIRWKWQNFKERDNV